jgi:hypothetical protein
MTLSVRYLIGANSVLAHPSGRTYTANSAGIVDVPIGDAEAMHTYIPRGYPDPDPSGLHRAQRLTVIGATSDRPGNQDGRAAWPPAVMYDTSLAKVIFLVPGSNPASWVDISGASV